MIEMTIHAGNHTMLQDYQIQTKLSKFKARCTCAQCSSNYEASLYDARKSRVGHLCERCKRRIIDLIYPTQKDLLEIFEYDPSTGNLRHRLDTLRGIKGNLATHRHSQGYQSISIGGKELLAHRVIWFMQTGIWPDQIDHIDHDRSNNQWNNLRHVNSQENQKNLSQKCSNTSGITGVRILPSGKFWAYIMVNRKQIALGSYDDLNNAKAARQAAEVKYGFHSNHGS